MRLASVPGYYPSFPVRYSNMYNDYSMTTAGLADPFSPQKKEESNKCNFVVSYIGRNEPKFEKGLSWLQIWHFLKNGLPFLRIKNHFHLCLYLCPYFFESVFTMHRTNSYQ